MHSFVYTHTLDIGKISTSVSNICERKDVIPRYKICGREGALFALQLISIMLGKIFSSEAQILFSEYQ